MSKRTCDIEYLNVILKEVSDIISMTNDIWQQITEANISDSMKLCTKFFIKLENLINCMNNINEKLKYSVNVNVIFGYINEMEKSMKMGDYILLSDLLKYEVEPIFKKWSRILNKNIKSL